MKPNTVVFSGIKPSGTLHLGNYLGALKQWIELQDTLAATHLYCIVDLHAITVPYDPATYRDWVFNLAVDLLALGLNPKKSVIFLQSAVREHTELMWLLNTVVPVGELERMTQYKDKKQNDPRNLNAGLLNYPVLMAADILLYKATAVPVGDDQVQHVELARVIARKFNRLFAPVFPEPQPQLTTGSRIMSLTNPEEKMAKSAADKGTVALADEPDVVRAKLAKAVTDTGTGGKLSPGTLNLLTILEVLDPKAYRTYEEQAKAGTIRYAELKDYLGNVISDAFAPFREKRKGLITEPNKVWNILDDGAEKAQVMAKKTMAEVREAMGLVYR